MYDTKILCGTRYTVSYPGFTGEGMGAANRFYEALAADAAKYFEELTSADRCAVCRGTFLAEDNGSIITVRITLTLRRGTDRRRVKALEHRWRRWDGRDAVLQKSPRKSRGLG